MMDTIIIVYIIIIAFAVSTLLSLGVIKFVDMIEKHYEYKYYKDDEITLKILDDYYKNDNGGL